MESCWQRGRLFGWSSLERRFEYQRERGGGERDSVSEILKES